MKACEIYQNVWRVEGKALKEAGYRRGSEGELDAGQKFLSKLQSFEESGGKDATTE
jgi:hypothetical protein